MSFNTTESTMKLHFMLLFIRNHECLEIVVKLASDICRWCIWKSHGRLIVRRSFSGLPTSIWSLHRFNLFKTHNFCFSLFSDSAFGWTFFVWLLDITENCFQFERKLRIQFDSTSYFDLKFPFLRFGNISSKQMWFRDLMINPKTFPM